MILWEEKHTVCEDTHFPFCLGLLSSFEVIMVSKMWITWAPPKVYPGSRIWYFLNKKIQNLQSTSLNVLSSTNSKSFLAFYFLTPLLIVTVCRLKG